MVIMKMIVLYKMRINSNKSQNNGSQCYQNVFAGMINGGQGKILFW